MPERFSASVAGRHMACHASADLPAAIPNFQYPEVDETKGMKGEGSRMHELYEQLVLMKVADRRKFIATLDQIQALTETRRFKVLTEQSTVADWLPSKPRTTVDHVLYTKDELHIIDFKWGAIEVDPFENEQLLFYGASFLHLAPRAKFLTLHIAQPKAGGLVSWECSATRMKQFMDDAIAADTAIRAGSVSFGPSDHCTFCPANPHSRGDKGKPLCPAMMQLLYPSKLDEQEILHG